ncbi:MAG: arabinan endo-1,5-alpha-L-arabinosidase, partial [Lachnospiraceae bacterium]|nr:arabinan endo-1,5-alpha-L-arabinosidase [Lachnospiraceae bacterium]
MNKAYLLAAIGAAVLLSGCGSGKTVPAELPEEEIVKGAFSAGASLHDPFMIEGGDGRFYCYGTHMTAAESEDLKAFKMWGNGVTADNKIFDNLIEEPFDAFSFVGKNTDKWYSVWAPSVIYNETKKEYVMYFCTTSSYIMSDLCY